MIVRYRPNRNDDDILLYITGKIQSSLDEWYGIPSHLEGRGPEIVSYRNCFMLRYAILEAGGQKKHILVKIRRNPKMTSLEQTVQADIHQNIPLEYSSLQTVHHHLRNVKENLGAVRPLAYIEKYHAIIMEEVPSRTLRQLLYSSVALRGSVSSHELSDAARKTGLWLYHFHHRVHSTVERQYSAADILQEVYGYAERIEASSRRRVRARTILDAFESRLDHIDVQRVTHTQSNTDMTCDNVLYSEDRRICVTDIKTCPAPVYSDLGLLLVHPETLKPQIFSAGQYYSEALLQKYRSQILAGYFQEAPGNTILVRVYTALKVLDKWQMYEDLMKRYRGVKHILSLPAAPYVSAYFLRLLKKHLANFVFVAAAMDFMQVNFV